MLRKHSSWYLKLKEKQLNQVYEIKINDQQVDNVNYTKFLGLYIYDELSWRKHIDQISTKILKMTGILAKARHVLSIQTLKTIYITMFYPYLTYCGTIWTSTYQTRLKPIITIQKKLVRLMPFSKYHDECKALFQSLKILNTCIYELNMYLIALFMYSYFSNNLPKYFNNNYFTLNKNIHSHDTRSASNVYIDYKRTNYGKFSLKHRGHIFGIFYQLN